MRGSFPASYPGTIKHQPTTINHQQSTTMMLTILTIPNELLDEIVSNLDSLATFNLLLSCRSLSSLLMPAKLRHAVAPRNSLPVLHWASRNGHLRLVQYLLTIFPVHLPDGLCDTALHGAARSGHMPIAEHLLLQGAAISRIDHMGLTALGGAFRGLFMNKDATAATIRLLLAHGADVDGDASHRPLKDAIYWISPRGARLLLDAGANPGEVDEVGWPLVLSAARRVETATIMEMLLDYGADINATNQYHHTAVMIGAMSGHLETTKILAERGATLNLIDIDGNSAFSQACMRNQSHIVEYLVAREGFSIDDDNLVSLTVTYGHDPALKVLIRRGAPTDRVNSLGQSVLHAAILLERKNVVLTLVENGADIEMKDKHGLTPPIIAIHLANLPIIAMLLHYWRYPVEGNRNTFILLRAACFTRSKKVVELLLSEGIDINMVDEDGLTVLAHAQMAGLSDVVEMLDVYGGA